MPGLSNGSVKGLLDILLDEEYARLRAELKQADADKAASEAHDALEKHLQAEDDSQPLPLPPTRSPTPPPPLPPARTRRIRASEASRSCEPDVGTACLRLTESVGSALGSALGSVLVSPLCYLYLCSGRVKTRDDPDSAHKPGSVSRWKRLYSWMFSRRKTTVAWL